MRLSAGRMFMYCIVRIVRILEAAIELNAD